MRFESRRTGFSAPDNTQYCYRDGLEVDDSTGYHPHLSTRFREGGAKTSFTVAKRELPELYQDRSECCGCTACESICPRGAISMEPDEEGFLYPVVDAARCVRCGKCMDACVFKINLIDR